MLTKTTLALAAALIIGTASAGFANENEDFGEGGYHLGPMGQFLGGDAVNPVYHRSLRGSTAHASGTCEAHVKFYTGLDGVRHSCP
jgi:hypothetical protein